jgi:aspartyl-tRNA(Asn)/glutamyl-tRNA(Gln) amidotransferase subunit A
LVLNEICGHDPRDTTSVEEPVPDYTTFLTGDVKGLKVGYPREFFAEGIDQGVKDNVMKALKELDKMGAIV